MAARVWGAQAAQRMGKSNFPDCTACRRPSDDDPLTLCSTSKAKRKAWGCDGESKREVFTIGCPRCFGLASPDDPCKECKGGVISLKRCPSAYIEAAPRAVQVEAGRAFAAYLAWTDQGLPPVSGGWLEQSQGFHQVCTLVDAERGRYNRIVEEHREGRRRTEANKQSSAAKPRRGPR